MNLILFDRLSDSIHLPAADPRALHIRKVLRAEEGALIFVGFVNAERARARIAGFGTDGSVELEVVSMEMPPQQLPIKLLVGLPRPHTVKRILFDSASMGVTEIHFFEAERGEPSYALSSLWTTDEWRDRLRKGAEQGFTTRIPQVAMHADLQSAISMLGHDGYRVALDNYEANAALSDVSQKVYDSAMIALGPERGFTKQERETFIKNGWQLRHMGPYVLRSETACVAAISVVAAALQLWSQQTVG